MTNNNQNDLAPATVEDLCAATWDGTLTVAEALNLLPLVD